ncbi:TIR domain-containing protein, partial [Protofrankia symbiont of Coriaria ruscifolia]|uniref:TIR domain-containing protein n=1 Tax=Protofrankia symbiont of Coriaria ruscifolia TaxID=1306542 RepID=UPI0013EF71A3
MSTGEHNGTDVTTGDNKPTVFLSYTEADEPWAVWIAWQLQDAGYRPRLQAWHSVPGRNFVDWINEELAAATCVLAILSPAYLRSDWCGAELNTALADAVKGRRTLIPIRVAPCDAPPLMRQLGWITLVDRSAAEARYALLAGLRAATDGEARPTIPRVYPGTAGGSGSHPPYPGPDDGQLTGRLLDLVTQACRSRYPDAAVEQIIRGGGMPYVSVDGQRGGERQRWPVAVSVEPPDMDVVTGFHQQVITPVYLPLDAWVDSELVHLGEPPVEEVLRQARRHRIRIYSLAEFEGRWDPHRYLARQTRRLAADPTYPSGLYVPQRFTVASPTARPGQHGAVQDDVFTAMRVWLDVEDARFLLVLGDFGHGKSFLLRELARRLPTELPQIIPLLIELGALEKSHSVDDLLVLHLAKSDEDGVSVRAVRSMVDQGKAVLLFDGFDELALRVTYDRAAEHLKTVLSAVTGRAKVVLTSRTQHFLTDDQHRTELGATVQLQAASREIHLADFDHEQIREFLTRLFHQKLTAAEQQSIGTGQTERDDASRCAEARRQADARLKLIESIDDLLGLSANPRMLEFIANLDEAELEAARTADGMITSADLYQKLVDRWLRYEVDRRQPTRGAYQTLNIDQLRQAVDALAIVLWTAAQETTDLSGMSATVQATLTDLETVKLDAAQATFIVGSGSLLVRTPEGAFRFVHRSVMEYLVAVQAAGQLTAGGTGGAAPGLLAVREMSDLMVDFLDGVADRTMLEQWARTVLAAQDAGGTAQRNALRVARKLGVKVEGAQLAGRDLRGQDLNGQNLRFAVLTRANLAGARLHQPDLTGADLTGADLADAVLVRPDLTGADLHHADLTGALLVRPNLTDTRLAGSRWTGAALFHPALDAGTAGIAELAPAAIVGRDPVDLMALPAADSISSVAIAGHLLAVAWGSAVVLLDATNLQPLRVLTGHTDGVTAVAFSPDGTTLATT